MRLSTKEAAILYSIMKDKENKKHHHHHHSSHSHHHKHHSHSSYRNEEKPIEAEVIDVVDTKPSTDDGKKRYKVKVMQAIEDKKIEEKKPQQQPAKQNQPTTQQQQQNTQKVQQQIQTKNINNQDNQQKHNNDNHVKVAKTVSQASKSKEDVVNKQLGFNINNFIKNPSPQQPVPQAPQQSKQIQSVPVQNTQPVYVNPNPAQNFIRQEAPKKPVDAATIAAQYGQVPQKVTVVQYPEGYDSLTPYNKCKTIRSIINSSNGAINAVHDPLPNMTLQQKFAELQNHVKFIEGNHRGDNALDIVQIYCLLDFINSPTLRSRMSQYNCVDRPAHPKLTEVPVENYKNLDPEGKYDMMFTMDIKDKHKKLLIMYCSVPDYSAATLSWLTTVEFKVVNK